MNSLAGNTAQAVTAIPPALGKVYQIFESATGAGEPASLNTASTLTSTAASIRADPNPVPAGRDRLGKTTVTWQTSDGTVVEVYVVVNRGAETLFARGSKGSAGAPWIVGNSTYDFRLYKWNGP